LKNESPSSGSIQQQQSSELIETQNNSSPGGGGGGDQVPLPVSTGSPMGSGEIIKSEGVNGGSLLPAGMDSFLTDGPDGFRFSPIDSVKSGGGGEMISGGDGSDGGLCSQLLGNIKMEESGLDPNSDFAQLGNLK